MDGCNCLQLVRPPSCQIIFMGIMTIFGMTVCGVVMIKRTLTVKLFSWKRKDSPQGFTFQGIRCYPYFYLGKQFMRMFLRPCLLGCHNKSTLNILRRTTSTFGGTDLFPPCTSCFVLDFSQRKLVCA